MQTMGALTNPLAATNAKVDRFTTHDVPQVVTAPNHPGSRHLSVMENPRAATSSAEPDKTSFADLASLAPTDDEETRGEEQQPRLSMQEAKDNLQQAHDCGYHCDSSQT